MHAVAWAGEFDHGERFFEERGLGRSVHVLSALQSQTPPHRHFGGVDALNATFLVAYEVFLHVMLCI
jgi:hypothetical protein